MGVLAASVLAVLVFERRVPYWIALALALLVGALTGAAIEKLLGWRLFDKSRLTLMVATIGVSQLILLAVLTGPVSVDPGKLTRWATPSPSRSTGGRQRRPELESGDDAAHRPVDRDRSVSLPRSHEDGQGDSGRGFESRCGAPCGYLRAPRVAHRLGARGSRVVLVGDPVRALAVIGDVRRLRERPAAAGLAAALIAGMSDFRLAFVAGMVIGVIEQMAIFYTDIAGFPDLSVALVLLVGLLLRARTLGREVVLDQGLVVEASEPPPPTRAANLLAVQHTGKIGWAVLFTFIAARSFFQGLGSQERAVFLLSW